MSEIIRDVKNYEICTTLFDVLDIMRCVRNYMRFKELYDMYDIIRGIKTKCPELYEVLYRVLVQLIMIDIPIYNIKYIGYP